MAKLAIVLNFLSAVLFFIGGYINDYPLYFLCGIVWALVGVYNLVRYFNNDL